MKYQTLKNQYYNVDKIITRKIKKGKRFYLIKWKGFSLEYCSWEPISHLTKILNTVEIFDNNFPNSIEKEEYAKFLKLYKKYKKKKMINSQSTIGNTNISSNKIIINLEDLNINEIKEEEENKIDEISSVNSIKEITIKIDKEKEATKIIDNDLEGVGECNNCGREKLIKPILVW